MKAIYALAVGALIGTGGPLAVAEQQPSEQTDRAASQQAPQDKTQAHDQQAQDAAQNPRVVRDAQEKLNAKGYNAGTPDGRMGRQTQDALKQMQQAQGMQPTGELDAPTLEILEIVLIPVGGEDGAPADGGQTGAIDQSAPPDDQSPGAEQPR